MKKICTAIAIFLLSSPAFAATNVPFTIAMSEAVNVTGSPRIAVDVGGVTRYATYASGTGTSSLTFTYAAQAGDVDLDGVTLSSPIDLNGGTITDLNGNPETDLTFTVPDTSGIKIDYPSLSMDFIADADGRYTLNGTAYNDLPAFLSATGGTFARNSVGTYYDASGTLQTASADQPRFDHDPVTHAPKGILIEESRTNLIVNGQGQGASGINFPTQWNRDQPFGGIELSSMSSGINTNGYGYFQFTVNGTTIFNNRLLLTPTTTRPNVTAGQTYTFSYGVQLISGLYPYTIQPVFMWYDSGGTQIGTSFGGMRTPTTSLLRYSDNVTPPTNTTSVRIRYDFTGYGGPTGTVVNFTMQISGTQLEQGGFPTSYIPTTTAAVTRAADILTIPTGGWFDISDSTLYLHSEIFGNPTGGRFQTGFGTDANNYLGFPYTTTSGVPAAAFYRAFGAGPIANGSPSLSFNTPFKTAVSYSTSENILKYIKNGTLSATSTGVNSMSSASYFYVGASPFNAAPISGRIQKTKYYPTRISDTQLLLLTQ